MQSRKPSHEYATEVAAAAQWALDRKDVTPNWNWWAFSRQNPSPDTLGYPDILCFHVVNILAAKGLLEPIEGQPNQYSLNLSDLKQWKEITRVSNWFERNVLFPLGWAGRHVWVFIFWTISLVISAALTHLIKKLIDFWIQTSP